MFVGFKHIGKEPDGHSQRKAAENLCMVHRHGANNLTRFSAWLLFVDMGLRQLSFEIQSPEAIATTGERGAQLDRSAGTWRQVHLLQLASAQASAVARHME